MMWSSKVPTKNYFSSLKMFEYMAAGRIIVGEAYPTVKEVLTHGVSAFLADPDSFNDLIRQLQNAIETEYPSSIAAKAREIAFKEYTWHVRAQKILTSLDDSA